MIGWSIATWNFSQRLGWKRFARSNTERIQFDYFLKKMLGFHKNLEFTWPSGLEYFPFGLLMQRWSQHLSVWKSTTLNSTFAPSGIAKVWTIFVSFGYFLGKFGVLNSPWVLPSIKLVGLTSVHVARNPCPFSKRSLSKRMYIVFPSLMNGPGSSFPQ